MEFREEVLTSSEGLHERRLVAEKKLFYSERSARTRSDVLDSGGRLGV